MSDMSLEAALLLRARAVAARLLPAQIDAILRLVSAAGAAYPLTRSLGDSLRHEGCVIPVKGVNGAPAFKLDSLGEIVGDVLTIEGRQIPGLGRVRRAGAVIYGDDGRIFANAEAGRWSVSRIVEGSLRHVLESYFPELAWS